LVLQRKVLTMPSYHSSTISGVLAVLKACS
jgi:hypothetical protein